MSQQPVLVPFQNWRSHAHLVALLQQRGFVVADAAAADAFLAHLSYYRFSGYCLAFVLVDIRNLCAHHARLWDRVWTIKPERPAGKDWQPPNLPSNSRLFATLLILRHMMKH
ncbi:MAG: hypothetical protein U1E05_13845, partial [Patescibacteria group bacterium]|nr:hypothetical protein [Patescibacteria group bacterium]